jgi:Spy/CpxP family protein refolding chaperone
MNNENKNVWQIRAATTAVFMLGFLAGALALNAYHVWYGASSNVSRKERYERVFNQLELTEQQKAETQQIFNETREQLQRLREEGEPRVREIRADADARLQRILTPEQWQKFQQLRDEMRGQEKREKKSQ